MIENLELEINEEFINAGLSLTDISIITAVNKYKIPVSIQELSKAIPMAKIDRRKISRLINSGFIKKEEISEDELILKLKNNSLDKDFICDWCKNNVSIVQGHHYPIPKSKGGKNIIHICPNCHFTFHKYFNNGIN